MPYTLTSYGATDVGQRRTNNEDTFRVVPEAGLFVVADGMGGHVSGQVASRLAADVVVEFVTRTCRVPGFRWPYTVPAGTPFDAAALQNALQYANERVYIEAIKDARHEGMGTTLCAVLAGPNGFTIAHVGDSRVYCLREGRLRQITRDHSLLNHYLDIGMLDPADAEAFEHKNVIVRAIGLKDYVEPEVEHVPVRDGDLYLLCTDGLTDLVDDWVLKNALEGEDEDRLDVLAERLVRLANHAGGTDNITVVLLRAAGSSAAAQAADEDTKEIPIPGSEVEDTQEVDVRRLFGPNAGQPRPNPPVRVDHSAPTPPFGTPALPPDPNDTKR